MMHQNFQSFDMTWWWRSEERLSPGASEGPEGGGGAREESITGLARKNDSQAVGETETESSAKQGTTGAEEKRMVGRPMFVDNM